jgi:hypothetical protein
MSDYSVPCTIFIKPQEGRSLPENFREQFIGEDGKFTYDKTRPAEPFQDDLEGSEVSDGNDGTLTIRLEPFTPPFAWLDHLGATYPELVIENEYHTIEGDASFGRTVWYGGGYLYDHAEHSMSVERYAYFGWYVDEDEDEDIRSWYPEFEEESKGAAVKALKDAEESSDWVALMNALFTARDELDNWKTLGISEDGLRLAIVTTDTSTTLLHKILTGEISDVDPIAAEIGCSCEVAEGEPVPAGTIDDLIPFLEQMAVRSAELVSLCHAHETKRDIEHWKTEATQEASA